MTNRVISSALIVFLSACAPVCAEQPKTDGARSEAAKSEPVKSEAAKTDTAKSEFPKSESPKPSASKAGQPSESEKSEKKHIEKESFEPDSLAQLDHEAIEAHKNHKNDVAQHLMEQVVAGLEKEKFSELSLAEALGNLSLILREGGKAKEADEILARAKAIRTRYHLPPAEPNLVDILPNASFRKQGTEMVKETADILDGRDPLYPPEKLPEKTLEAWSASMLKAQQYLRAGNTKQEFWELRKALAIANSLPKPNDKMVSSMNLLGDVYRHLGRPYSARMLFIECLALDEKLGKSDTPEYATLLDHAGQTLVMLHEYSEAEKLLSHACDIYRKALGAENADLAMTMCTLGELYIQQKQDTKGEKLLTDALAMMKKVLKADDFRILVAEDYLGSYYSRHGKLKEAEELQTTVVSKMEKSFGKTHPDLVLALNNLAQTLYREQKYAEADPLLKRCIELNQQVYGPKHPRTLHAMGSYASFLEKTGHKDEADKILKQITAPQ